MAHWTRYSSAGDYTSGEKFYAFFPRKFKKDATLRPVIMCRGGAGDATFAGTVAQCREWAEAGFPIIHPDLGTTSGDSWGRDDALTKMTAARNYMTGTWGCKTDKVILAGGSGGTLEELNWVKANPTQVACIVNGTPAIDLEDLHDSMPIRLAPAYSWVPADIETKYGSLAAYQAVKETKSPINWPGDLSGIPQFYCYNSDDLVALGTLVPDWVEAIGESASLIDFAPGTGTGAHALPDEANVLQREFALPYLRS